MAKKILIVDDSPVARKILKKCLPEGHGSQLYEASNGLDGLERYKEVSPDVTFMDLTMPVMGGLEAIREIRKINEEAVIIVLTADVQAKAVSRALESGALMVVRKPPNRDSIQEALGKAYDE